MTKNIIFPINNKGGVGKTSILTDLSSTLAQRHPVGIIDTDHQASLAGTLLNNENLSSRELSYYDNMGVYDLTLMGKASFNFNNNLSSMGLYVDETKAKLAVFPLGLLHDLPEKKNKLETIINQEMKEASFLSVDLPPIPHPSMILDYTIMPIVEILQKDVNLFPLLVSTPEHNVIDICLRQYQFIEKYFKDKGIPKENIFPISVLNKVPLQKKIEGKKIVIYADIDSDITKKLGGMGIIYVDEFGHSGINHFNKGFEYRGRKFRSVAFPFLDYIKDKRFSLLWGEKPNLYHYPHLVDLAKGNKFEVESFGKPIESVYLYALRELVNYIQAKSGEKPQKNYIKKKVNFDLKKVTSEAVKELECALKKYYIEKIKDFKGVYINLALGCSSDYEMIAIPKSISVEQLADAIVKTQKKLRPSSSIMHKEVLESLCWDGNVMKLPAEYELKDENGTKILNVSYYWKNVIVMGFLSAPWDSRYNQDLDINKYLGKINIFLNELDKAFERPKLI